MDGAPDILCVEARNAAKHPTIHKTNAHNKELSGIQNVRSAEVKKPCVRYK